MYEISLVPDVKSELLKKQKLRNLIFFICLIVAASCGGLILLLLGFIGTQSLEIAAQENEINCRADGSGVGCGSYGTPVLKYPNVNELLTIQSQMKNVGVLNNNKIKFSRVFGLLDVILPDGVKSEDTVLVSELNGDISQNLITFDAIGYARNNIGYHALESFKKSTKLTYFDYGSYMRLNEDGEYEPIPSYCITEYIENGYIYGRYLRYSPGCENDMIVKSNDDNKEQDDSDEDNDEAENNDDDDAEKKQETQQKKIEEVIIRRTYKNAGDREEYKNGNDSMAEGNKEGNTGKYYFESQCLQYDDSGNFDEEATISECSILSEDGLFVANSGWGKGPEDKMVLSFSVNLTLDPRLFLSSSKHMQIIGPSRQNVTDSYIQVRDMFAEKARDVQREES
ncbi:MAG: hypothetical protein K5837_04790 [Candidatus Saccharibacteria bacterium]|nr:hypothetical protein [Candidatus Saccharibacteria bacterium]